MDIDVTQEQGRVPVTVFHVNGSVDAASYEQLQSRAEQAIQGGTTNLLLDLSRVPYMSSAGLRAINHIYNLFHKETAGAEGEAVSQGLRTGKFKSPHLKLLNPTPRVLEVLQMTGFDMFLEIHHNLKEAVASF
jgi:anti-anti-sigma factor